MEDQLTNFMENSNVDFLLASLEKWGLSAFLLLHAIFSLLIFRQITLLDQFIPTKGGKWLRGLALLYTLSAWLLLVFSLVTL